MPQIIYQVWDHGEEGNRTRVHGYYETKPLADIAARGLSPGGRGDIEEIKVHTQADEKEKQRREALAKKAKAKLTAEELEVLGLKP